MTFLDYKECAPPSLDTFLPCSVSLSLPPRHLPVLVLYLCT